MAFYKVKFEMGKQIAPLPSVNKAGFVRGLPGVPECAVLCTSLTITPLDEPNRWEVELEYERCQTPEIYGWAEGCEPPEVKAT